jgi:hypothetical protein
MTAESSNAVAQIAYFLILIIHPPGGPWGRSW